MRLRPRPFPRPDWIRRRDHWQPAGLKVAVDIYESKLAPARRLGASLTVNAAEEDPADPVISEGPAGEPEACW